jgi:type IV pilus assembly protein PilC
MKNYQYIARDATGARRHGFSQALSSTDVIGWLREKGYTPVSVNEVAMAEAKTKRKTGRKKRIKSSDLAALCWQLTTMVEGGISIAAALDTIAEDIENRHLQEILHRISDGIQKGQTFSDCLAEFPKVFNSLSRAMILAGETGGMLPATLRRVAEYFDNRDKLAKKVKGAMAYPAVVFVFIILIVTFIMTFIVPRFATIFEQFGTELPAFTQGFMGFYHMLRVNILYIVGFIILLISSGVFFHKTSTKGHYFFSRVALALPLIGKILSQSFIAMFCKTMSTLLGAGVSVLEVFEILSGMTNNDIIKDAIEQTRERILSGANIHAGLAESGFFPNLVTKMVQVGEESGSLSNVLERTSDYYERKVDSTITTVMGMLEPIMIVTVGAIVLVVVLALYLPIFSMSAH